MELSLILPIYNQYENLRENFQDIYSYMVKNFGNGNFEIVIIDDGSTDRSFELEKSLAKRKGVMLLQRKENGGKGSALRAAIPRCRGRVIGFIDPDLAVPMRYVRPAAERVLGGCDIVIGSRYVKGARYRRRTSRLIISRTCNFLVRAILGSDVTDHVCGFKFMRSGYIKGHLRELRDQRWFFDTEMVVMAQRHGAAIYETPVEWRESTRSTFRTTYSLGFLWAIILMRIRLAQGKE